MLLKLEKIGKIYDSNDILTVGIRGIDLAFDYNEFVTIEGESGSGKSTLLNVIGANDTCASVLVGNAQKIICGNAERAYHAFKRVISRFCLAFKPFADLALFYAYLFGKRALGKVVFA